MGYLVASIILGFLTIFLAAGLSTQQRGLAWNASARDGESKPLTGVAGRMERASKNFQETFPLYLAAMFAAVTMSKVSAQTDAGSMLHFWARVVYLPLYAFGVPYLRSVAWGASIVGIGMIIASIFQ